MSLLDPFARSLRAFLGDAEREVMEHTPLAETRDLEAKLLDAVEAVGRATDSIERHVEVIETLALSLPPLTDAVTLLSTQISELLRLTTPIASAEREVSRFTHLFGRHPHEQEAAPQPGGDAAPGPGGDAAPGPGGDAAPGPGTDAPS
jgi:hypothetical protein